MGAGIAGLGAAYTLRSHGLTHTILEAGSRPGGRVITDVVDGFHIDAGANIFLESYASVRAIADELGVAFERPPIAVHGAVYHGGKFCAYYAGDKIRDRLRTARTFLTFQLLSPKGLWQAQKFFRLLKARQHDLSFDDCSRLLDLDTTETASTFFEAQVGGEFLERFIEPSLSSYSLGYPEQIGAVYPMIAAWNFATNWPFMPARGLGPFMDALIEAGAANIVTSQPVRRIVHENGAVRGVATQAGFLEADAVICATTATTALQLLPDLPARVGKALSRVTYSKCCRVVFGLDENPFPEADWYALAFPRGTGALITGMSNSAVLVPESVPEGKHLVDAFVIGDQARRLFALSDSDIRDEVIAEIRRYLPAMPEKPLFTRIYRWHEAVCLAHGGMMTEMHRLRSQGDYGIKGLFLAGEYMGVPSTNGALRSGIVAAADCADAFGAGRAHT